jgi:hypothetical protein
MKALSSVKRSPPPSQFYCPYSFPALGYIGFEEKRGSRDRHSSLSRSQIMTFPGNCYTRSPSIPLALSERLRQEKGGLRPIPPFLRGARGDRV